MCLEIYFDWEESPQNQGESEGKKYCGLTDDLLTN